VILFCYAEVDMRAKFCFVEYDSHTAAQKAIDAEDGRDFKGTNLSINFVVLFGFIHSLK